MPLFVDEHETVDGLTAEAVTGAHAIGGEIRRMARRGWTHLADLPRHIGRRGGTKGEGIVGYETRA